MDSLRGKGLLRTVLGEVGFTILVLHLDHVHDTFEPLGKKYGILSTTWLSKVRLRQADACGLLFDVFLEPLRLVFVLFSYAWLGQLVTKVVQRLEQLLLSSDVSLFHLLQLA